MLTTNHLQIVRAMSIDFCSIKKRKERFDAITDNTYLLERGNMKIIPVLVQGSLTEPITYNFGSLYPINKGEWELCLKTLAVTYRNSAAKDPKPPNLDKFICLRCNYVESLSLNASQTQSISSESVLSILHFKLQPGQKKLYDFSERDYFFVSSPSQKFQFHLLNSDGSSLPDNVKKHLNVQALFLFRRRN